jgi:hypothetical protein
MSGIIPPPTEGKEEQDTSPVQSTDESFVTSIPEINNNNMQSPLLINRPGTTQVRGSTTNIGGALVSVDNFENLMMAFLSTPRGKQIFATQSASPPPVAAVSMENPRITSLDINNNNDINTSSVPSSINNPTTLHSSDRKPVKIKPPNMKYGGPGSNLEEWTQAWKVHFIVARITSETERIGMAQQTLTGVAQKWYLQLASTQDEIPFKSFADMCARFHRMWEPDVDVGYWLQQLFQLKCGSSVATFCGQFTVTYAKVKQHISDFVAMHLLLIALPGALKMEIKGRNPETLQDALDWATRLERFSPHLVTGVKPAAGVVANQNGNKNRNNNGRTNQTSPNVSQPSSSAAPSSGSSSGGSSTTKKKKVPTRPCKHCGQEGHMDYDCPSSTTKSKQSGKNTVSLTGNALGGAAPVKA